MTGAATVSVVAHHSLLLAIPAFLPAFAVAGVVIYVAMRDRRQPDGPASNGISGSAGGENTGDSDQDGKP